MQKHVPADKICLHYFTNKRYMKEVHKRKQVYLKLLVRKMVIAILALLYNDRKNIQRTNF